MSSHSGELTTFHGLLALLQILKLPRAKGGLEGFRRCLCWLCSACDHTVIFSSFLSPGQGSTLCISPCPVLVFKPRLPDAGCSSLSLRSLSRAVSCRFLSTIPAFSTVLTREFLFAPAVARGADRRVCAILCLFASKVKLSLCLLPE